MSSTPARIRVRNASEQKGRRVGGATIVQLKKWIEKDFCRKFSQITRTVDRPRKAIVFKMWGPWNIYTITAWEKGGNPFRDPFGNSDYITAGDGLIASSTARYTSDGEDWDRGEDLNDGPLNKDTWDRISEQIRFTAIHTLPPIKSTHWSLFNKGTTRDMVKAGVKIRLTPTLKGAADTRARKAARKATKAKKAKSTGNVVVKTRRGIGKTGTAVEILRENSTKKGRTKKGRTKKGR